MRRADKMKVIIKKINDRAYELIECPEVIDDMVWGDCVDLTDTPRNPETGIKIFHCTWLEKLQEACMVHNVELIQI